jgi:hypothetical protein
MQAMYQTLPNVQPISRLDKVRQSVARHIGDQSQEVVALFLDRLVALLADFGVQRTACDNDELGELAAAAAAAAATEQAHDEEAATPVGAATTSTSPPSVDPVVEATTEQ